MNYLPTQVLPVQKKSEITGYQVREHAIMARLAEDFYMISFFSV